MRRLFPLLALASIFALATPAAAKHERGRIVSVKINTPGSSSFSSYRGSVVIRNKGKKTTYKWGGSTCPGKDLTEDQINLLFWTLRSGLGIKPESKAGQGQGNRCLVGFELSRGKDKHD